MDNEEKTSEQNAISEAGIATGLRLAPNLGKTDASTDTVPRDKTPLRVAFDEATEAHQLLGRLLSNLETCLKPVLRPLSGEGENSQKSPPQPPVSDVTRALQEKNSALRSYAHRIKSLLDRLEV